jgi:hypothetical protein
MSTLKEITAERFEEMFNILPPMAWKTSDAFDQKFNRIPETFMLSEMLDEKHTTQFAKLVNRYAEKTIDVTDRSTWITGKEMDGPEASRMTVSQRIEADRVRRAGQSRGLS